MAGSNKSRKKANLAVFLWLPVARLRLILADQRQQLTFHQLRALQLVIVEKSRRLKSLKYQTTFLCRFPIWRKRLSVALWRGHNMRDESSMHGGAYARGAYADYMCYHN